MGAEGATPLLWVVGAGGLVGNAVVTAARQRGTEVRIASGVRWHDPDLAAADLADAAAGFMAAADGRPWQVAWCAGAGVTATSAESLDAERRVFEAALDALSRHGADPRGAVFLASSAGGVYAGSPRAPFDEHSPPAPLAPYGVAKLVMEGTLRSWAQATGVSVIVGRMANVYGPGQDLGKAQGLISHVCLAQLTRRPISIYVPLDTLRHYIYAPDCGALIVAGLAGVQAHAAIRGPQQWLKVVTSREPASIGFVLAELNRILKRRPLVVRGASSSAKFQSTDLRLRSVEHLDLDTHVRTSLVVGMSLTIDGMREVLGRGGLA